MTHSFVGRRSVLNFSCFVSTRCRLAIITSAVALLLTAKMYAVDPPADGGYPGQNTAEGDGALITLKSGTNNTAVGFNALFNCDDSSNNTAVGSRALFSSSLGTENTALGVDAMYGHTQSTSNVAIGYQALYGGGGEHSGNTAVGAYALWSGIGDFAGGNTAIGVNALYSAGYNGGSAFNTAVGAGSLSRNAGGIENTAVGNESLQSNTTGSDNIAVGDGAGSGLTTGDYNIDIGSGGVAGEGYTIRIGSEQSKTYVAGIRGVVIGGGQAVGVSATGQLGVRGSSARFKQGIKPMNKTSEAILSLRPVSFRYKKTLDPAGQPQFGLIAEEVAKVDPDLVVNDENGAPLSVRYEEINAMLLNEFLKEHHRAEQRDRKIEELESTVAKLKTMLKAPAGADANIGPSASD